MDVVYLDSSCKFVGDQPPEDMATRMTRLLVKIGDVKSSSLSVGKPLSILKYVSVQY